MIRFTHYGLRCADVYFDEAPDKTGVDVLLFHCRSCRPNTNRWLFSNTILVDLTQTPEALLAGMDKTTTYEIRRARDKDGITTKATCPVLVGDLERFISYYNQFARQRELAPMYQVTTLRLWHTGSLWMTEAQSQDGETLVMHAYILQHSQKRARLLHSASWHAGTEDSARRALIGRANRFLHFQDMLALRGMGVSAYDLGGWYSGQDDTARLRINQFKESFGGKIVFGYECEEGVTWLGNLYLFLRDARSRLFNPVWRKERQRRRTPAPQALPMMVPYD